MRFMMLVKADKNSELGVLPDEKLLSEMGKYNEDMVKAGVMLAAEGLHPSSKGARVRFSDGKFTVTYGPFTEPADEIIAGYWIIEVKWKEEAIEWARRCPGEDCEIELRPSDYQDFPTQPGVEKKIRFLSIYTPDTTVPPSPQHMADVGKLVEEAVKSGELLAMGARPRPLRGGVFNAS